jgi:hypothetical protein
MKKIILILFIAFAINSCTTDSNNDPVATYLVLPVDSVVMPTTLAVDETSTIVVKYKKPSNCYGFNGFYYEKSGLTRTVAIEAVLFDQGNCQVEANNLHEANLNFTPSYSGTYTFKFWIGPDANGVDQYYTVDAIVP